MSLQVTCNWYYNALINGCVSIVPQCSMWYLIPFHQFAVHYKPFCMQCHFYFHAHKLSDKYLLYWWFNCHFFLYFFVKVWSIFALFVCQLLFSPLDLFKIWCQKVDDCSNNDDVYKRRKPSASQMWCWFCRLDPRESLHW